MTSTNQLPGRSATRRALCRFVVLMSDDLGIVSFAESHERYGAAPPGTRFWPGCHIAQYDLSVPVTFLSVSLRFFSMHGMALDARHG